MGNLLYLVHRIPYPPNKGDKIRSFHVLQDLAKKWKVHLGAFIDDPDDWKHVDELWKYCADVQLVSMKPLRSKFRSVSGLVFGKPLSIPYYYNRTMAAWVEEKFRNVEFDAILVFSSVMAQYVLSGPSASVLRVIDFVDVDSDKWRQYATGRAGIMRFIYKREAKKLLEFERRVASEFDMSLFVSEHEKHLFARLAPECAGRISSVNNGVDLKRYALDVDYRNPYQPPAEVVVFTGAMDYWANVDAVRWFVEEVWPRIHQARPNAQFYIVGSKPTEEVKVLGKISGVIVTGAVDDVRPYLAHAHVAVAPMRIARGVQNKVLEAMAMAVPVVTSPAGFEGIEADVGNELVVADNADRFVDEVLALFYGERRERLRHAGRRRIEMDYSWDRTLLKLDEVLRPRGYVSDLTDI